MRFSIGLDLGCWVWGNLLSLLHPLVFLSCILIAFTIALGDHCHLVFVFLHICLVQVLRNEEAVLLRRSSLGWFSWLTRILLSRGHLVPILWVLLFLRLVLQNGLIVLYRQRLALKDGTSLAPSMSCSALASSRRIWRSLLMPRAKNWSARKLAWVHLRVIDGHKCLTIAIIDHILEGGLPGWGRLVTGCTPRCRLHCATWSAHISPCWLS